MTQPTNYKYHSTSQFRNVIKHVQTTCRFVGLDGEGNAIFDNSKPLPKLEFIGTTKLHGTNASIVLHEDNTISFHSKSNLLAYVVDGEFTLLSDNVEFAQSMQRRMDSVVEVIDNAKLIVKRVYGADIRPIKISGVWCGQGVQKGVGISYLPKRSLFIFGIKAGDNNQEVKQGWLPVEYTSDLTSQDTELDGIYAITDFPFEKVEIDFAYPEQSQNFLVEATHEVEKNCPVATQLQLKDPDGLLQTLGEGLVWTPTDPDWCYDTGTWFKTKGEKHSVSKVKTLAAVDPEKVNSIKEFVDYAVTDNRLEQGITEVGLDVKLTGKFIGWVSQDINKEEADTLEDNNLTMKDVGKYIADKARQFYMNKL